MKIYRSIQPDKLTQGFDANPSMVDFYKKMGMTNHGGYDWACKTGTPIYFDVADFDKAYVLNNEIDSAGGLGINIITETKDGVFKHRYWHLQKFACKAGEQLKTGDLIGWADNTGRSTGSHLHRDIKQMFWDDGQWTNMNQDNGTFGTIRWDNWFTDKFVLEVLDNKSLIRELLIAKIKHMIY